MSKPIIERGEVCRNRRDNRVLHVDIEMQDGTVHRHDVVFKDLPATERINAGRINKASEIAFREGVDGLRDWARRRRARIAERASGKPGFMAAEDEPDLCLNVGDR